jgi:hypothetical protein
MESDIEVPSGEPEAAIAEVNAGQGGKYQPRQEILAHSPGVTGGPPAH